MLTEFGDGTYLNESDIVALIPQADALGYPRVEIYLRGGGRLSVAVGPRREPHTSTYDGHEETLERAKAWIRDYSNKDWLRMQQGRGVTS
jgi:hypothetical protein